MIQWAVYKGEAVPELTGGNSLSVSDSWYYYDWNQGKFSRSVETQITPHGTFVTDVDTYSITFASAIGPPGSRTATSSETINTRSTTYATYTSEFPSYLRIVYGHTSTVVSTFEVWQYTEDEYGYGDYFQTTDTREAAKAVTAGTQTTTSLWTTKTTTGASGTITQFTTSTQNVPVVGISYQTEVSTEISVTTTGSTVKDYTHGFDKFDVIVQADPGEVLHVIEASKIDYWEGANRPFLTEIATTATRITISHTPTISTFPNTYTSSTPPPTYGPSSNIWLTSEITETYRQLTTVTAPTMTATDYEGVVPTPTRTATYFAYHMSTTQGTFTVAITTGSWISDSTVVYKRMGKIPRVTKENRLIGWSEPVTETGLPTWQTARYFNIPYDKTPVSTYDEIIVTATSSYTIKGQPSSFAIDTGSTPEFPLSDETGGTSPFRWGKTFEGNHYRAVNPQYQFAPDFFGEEGQMHLTQLRPYGVMTSPNEFYGRLSLNGKTISTPTFARFHRTNGGLGLMPTSAGEYTANVTAVTYTTGSGTSTTTTSQAVSAIESGVTRIFYTRAAGGAAGFGETNYNWISGFCKVNGSKLFFPATSTIKTITESTAAASHIEFPWVVGVGANNPGNNAGNGPFYTPGNYSYTDILND